MNSAAFVEELKGYITALDVPKFTAKFTENGTIRLGNNPPAHGHAEVAQYCQPFNTHLSSITFSDSSVEDTPTSIIWQSMTSFHRKDGFVLTVPCCVVIHREGDLVKDYLGYMDLTGLFTDAPKP